LVGGLSDGPDASSVHLLNIGSNGGHQRVGIDAADRHAVDARRLFDSHEQQHMWLWGRQDRSQKRRESIRRVPMVHDKQGATTAGLCVA
jgi:hypothetical protein